MATAAEFDYRRAVDGRDRLRRLLPTLAAALAVAAAVAGASGGVAASAPDARSDAAAKKRCKAVVKKVRGKKTRVRVCQKVKPKPKPVAELTATVAGPSEAAVGSALMYTVTVTNTGPGVARQLEVDPAIGWFPIGVPDEVLPRDVSVELVGRRACSETERDREVVYACPVGALPARASVEVRVGLQLGRIAGRLLYVDTVAYTTSRDSNRKNSEAIANATMTGCHPSYPGDLCIAPPPPDLNCDDLPVTGIEVDQTVADPDPHGFDGDHDGVGCESSSSKTLAARAASAGPSGRFTMRGEVGRVVDGDTLDVERDNGSSTRVRLIGIDTPERGECFSRKATSAARRLALGARVVLKGDSTQATRDRYGRLLAYVWLPGGKDLGYRLLAGGYARVYVYDRPFRRVSAYRHGESMGRKRRPSVWTCGRAPAPAPTRSGCDPSYPTVCIPRYPPDLDCDEVPYSNFRVVGRDPHGFDGDGDGVGCES